MGSSPMEARQALPFQQVTTHGAVVPKALRAARQFETLLLANLLGPLERTFSAIGGEEKTPGSDAYQSLGMQAIASILANHGGIGIADMIARSLAASGGRR